jgi:hypothetical protein
MGGGVELLETALRIPPWEPLYRLSVDELQRMKLSTIDTLDRADITGSVPPKATTSVVTVGHPGAKND